MSCQTCPGRQIFNRASSVLVWHTGGMNISLITTLFLLGLRHGADLDHIAALTDLTAMTENRWEAMKLGSYYIAGHGIVLLSLGVLAAMLSVFIPPWFDELSGRIVGLTLVLMGSYLIYSFVKNREEMRYRGRVTLLIEWSRRTIRHLQAHRRYKGHNKVTDDRHIHDHAIDKEIEYTQRSSLVIGMIHGIGAETPTQLALFLAAGAISGVQNRLLFVVVFVVGLAITNTVMLWLFSRGQLSVRKSPVLYHTIGLAAASFSLLIGVSYLSGFDLI